MARPTKLTEEILRDTKTYIQQCEDMNKLPTIEGLSFILNLNKITVQDWRKPYAGTNSQITPQENIDLVKLHEEFSILIEGMMNKQADKLVNKGLDGSYNPTIAKVLLTKHGYREGTETDITSQGDKIMSPVLPELIAEADRLLKEKKLNQ